MNAPDSEVLALLRRVLLELEEGDKLAGDPVPEAQRLCRMAMRFAAEDVQEVIQKLQGPPPS